MEWEVRLIEWMQGSLGGFGSVLGKAGSFIGGEAGLLLILLIVLFCWKKKEGKRLAVTVVAVNVFLPMIKGIVLRPRPYMEYPDRVNAHALVDKSAAAEDIAAQGYSFPSMHSASAGALYFSLARVIKKRWMWITAAAVTLLVGISRVAVGMHYPTDVLAGWGLGLAVVGISVMMEKMVKTEWIRRLIVLALALPGLFFVRTQDYFTSLGLLCGMVAAFPFEERYVRFQETCDILNMILRLAGAFAVYLVLNTLLKLPFSKAFLNSGDIAALLIRTVRYTVISFVLMGVYPMVFPFYERIGKKKQN